MKFSAAVLSLFAIGASAVMPPQGSEARAALLRAATQLENNNMNKMTPRNLGYEFALSEEHSVQFQSCVTLTTEPWSSDIFYSDYNVQAAQAGAIKSEKSYVVFNVCETDSCVYNANNNVFMVELETYVRSTMSFYPSKKNRYCKICQMSEEYCM